MSATNVVVGSISLETPPSHIKDELHNSTISVKVNTANAPVVAVPNGEKRQRPNTFAGMSTKSSASRDSTDTVEELVLVPSVAATAILPEIVTTSRPRTLVRQRSSTASVSPHPSPKSLTLKNARPKITALPMVSVSGPSPPHEKPLPQPTTECL